MIIRRIEIENFRSYYGNENIFEFGDGLTLILGDNGDGKSTFFEALQWLLDISKTDDVQKSQALDNFSEMKKSKLEIGETAKLRVKVLRVAVGLIYASKSIVKRLGLEAVPRPVPSYSSLHSAYQHTSELYFAVIVASSSTHE